MVSINIVRHGLGLISTAILARLLPPDDFGLVAMASILILMSLALTEFGFDVALIQNHDATDSHYNTAWTFNIIFGLSSAVLVVLLAVPAARFFDEPRIVPIIIALSFGIAFRGFQNIGIVDFRKYFHFQKEFIFHSAVKLIGFVVTLISAFLMRSYWALIIGTLTTHVTSLLLSYVLHSYRPRFSIAARRELFSFSIWMFLSNLLLFVRTRFGDLMVGRLLGSFQLGLLTIAQEISSLPTEQLIAPINRAIYPGYAKIVSDRDRLTAAFLNVTSIVGMLAFPSAVGIAVISKLAVPLFLGDQWTEAIPLVEALAIVGLFGTIPNTGAVYFALGKPSIVVYLQLGSAIILFPLAYYFVGQVGTIGIAYAYLFANGAMFLANCYIATRVIGVRASALIAVLIRPLLASMVMFSAVRLVQTLFVSELSLIVGLFFCIIVGTAVFVVSVLLIWLVAGKPDGAESYFLNKAEQIPHVRILARALLGK